MRIDELPTPCLVVEERRLESNLRRMQEKANHENVVLRPHAKTHKSAVLAGYQRARGAAGITVAKLGEAEVFAEKGFSDIRLAYPTVGRGTYERILQLMQGVRVSCCLDTDSGAKEASDFFASQGSRAEVLVEVDTGYGRSGVPWDHEESIRFVRWVSELPGLDFKGILTHAGQSYDGPSDNESPDTALQRASEHERDRMLLFASRLRKAGVSGDLPGGGFEISIGSTPSMKFFKNRNHDGFSITEIRPGNYVFNDMMQVALGVVSLEDCALTVLTTVVSKHRGSGGAERLFLDAGKKVLTTDTGYGTIGYGAILYNPVNMTLLPHARITALSEEHGWVKVTGGSTLQVGDRIRLVPNHACVTVNMMDQYYLIDGEDVVETWRVDARGKVS